jgi:protein-S-isoprenylcysteine O-methyltransferase Ste14
VGEGLYRRVPATAWAIEAAGAGLLLGAGARGAMRLLAWMSGSTGFSRGGSVEIVIFGALLGAPVALAILLARQWRGWTHPWVGLWTALALFAAAVARPSPSAAQALASSPLSRWTVLAVFGGVFALFGLWIDLRWRRRTGRPSSLVLRSGAAALLMPGIVAGVLPVLILRGGGDAGVPLVVAVAGYLLAGSGLALLAASVIGFAQEGHGTLAPYDPPTALVARGPYRVTRNPMYVGVLAILLGLSAAHGSGALLWYAVLVAACFATFVRIYEEPRLEAQFGEPYRTYKATVPRWVSWRRPSGTAARRREE